VNENMAVAARAHLAEWGRGVAGRTMIAFGGAAPLHACLLAKKLKIERIVVPSDAGVGSAVGFLLAPVGYEVVRSHYMRLDELDRDAIIELMGQMYEEAAGVVEPVADPRTLVVTRRAFMRYLGQGFEIAVVLDADLGTVGPGRLREQFEAAYERLYGRLIPGLDVEILSWTLNLSESTKARRLPEDRVSPVRRAAAEGRRPLFDVIVAGNVDAGYYERANLQPGDFLDGPALVTEPQTTVVVGSGYRATVSERGTLVIEALAGEEGGDG
jgi:N-methylhydantoinase A